MAVDVYWQPAEMQNRRLINLNHPFQVEHCTVVDD